MPRLFAAMRPLWRSDMHEPGDVDAEHLEAVVLNVIPHTSSELYDWLLTAFYLIFGLLQGYAVVHGVKPHEMAIYGLCFTMQILNKMYFLIVINREALVIRLVFTTAQATVVMWTVGALVGYGADVLSHLVSS